MRSLKDDETITFVSPGMERFAVILAGGDGTRLLDLTKRITGCERPKQFCPIFSDETLLAVTQKRVELQIKPENTFFSLNAEHEAFFRPLLSGVPKRQKIVQPENKGTAPAVLYSLLRLAKINPEAMVAFFPSDHYVSDDPTFMDHVETAFEEVTKKPDSVVLLGIEPASPEPSYGWIELPENAGEIAQIKRFWEKPDRDSANELMKRGCLWNSFVMVGKVRTFLDLYRKHLLYMYRLFCAVRIVIGTSAERISMKTAYSMIRKADFSREVLVNGAEDVCVLRVRGVSWSDLGEPNRVILKLAQLGLKSRIFPMAA